MIPEKKKSLDIAVSVSQSHPFDSVLKLALQHL